MYAVIETGGKQYRVQPGDIFQVEKLEGDVGAGVTFSNVLMTSKMGTDNSTITLGKPFLKGATVAAEIVGQGRGEKILIVKMKRRKQYRRTQGHRQFYTQLICTALDNGAGEKLTLDATEKKTKLGKFQSHLAAKGPAMTPKTLGSRKRLAAAKLAAPKTSTATTGEAKKTATKKAPAKAKAKKD
jgi:large subunit ribosomal protein L21